MVSDTQGEEGKSSAAKVRLYVDVETYYEISEKEYIDILSRIVEIIYEIFGNDWISAQELLDYMNAEHLSTPAQMDAAFRVRYHFTEIFTGEDEFSVKTPTLEYINQLMMDACSKYNNHLGRYSPIFRRYRGLEYQVTLKR